jgi:hypothetical protein
MFTFAQTLLDIDDKKGCLHGVGCSTKVACGQRRAGRRPRLFWGERLSAGLA